MKFKYIICLIFLVSLVEACKKEKPETIEDVYITNVYLNGSYMSNGKTLYELPVDSVIFLVQFSSEVDVDKIDPENFYISNGVDTSFVFIEGVSSNEVSFRINKTLNYYSTYTFYLASGECFGVNITDGYSCSFITEYDMTAKFPTISNDSLLTLVQEQTFKYFWDYAHPTSGLSRERYNSGETVTSGGSGFGIMTIPVGIERGFISRQEGLDRMTTIVNFLKDSTETFHGAYSHWINGSTGEALPFTTKDNGADLVETAFLIEGLLTVQQYFDQSTTQEETLRANIDSIWHRVEWTWFQQDGQQVLYWHWSPDYNWDMNMTISGWNEALIIYVLAASSPTYPISSDVYDNGWAGNGSIINGNSYYDITLPLGGSYGGSMFFAHYSFFGLDPTDLYDDYANYWEQNIAHANINHSYCVANPSKNYGYSDDCWGLTASDIPDGYSASSPTNDLGVIAPTAALASFPYTPDESMQALQFFYYVLGDKIWGDYGFNDAFCLNERWFADSYIAIDQGPIILMIENYRTGLLWNLFMQNDDVIQGLTNLGFHSSTYGF